MTPVIANAIASFGKETDPKVLGVKPWRIELVTPAKSLSVQEFAQAYPGPASPQELAILNQIEASGRYEAGKPAKRVVGEKLP